MLLYEMISGNVPYHDVADHDVVTRIKQGPIIDLSGITDEFSIALMTRCFSRDPAARPTAVQILDELNEELSRECAICLDDFPFNMGIFCSTLWK